MTALTGRVQIETTSSIMHACQVYSSKITHAGRHAGTKEAYDLKLNLEHIRHLGRWVMGQMENFYAPKNPIVGAFYMAHFNDRDAPYFIERDMVNPPLELQRKIFPWIETSFKDIPDKDASWVEECNAEMEGIDPKKTTENDVFWDRILDGSAKRLSQVHTSDVIERSGFLKLMVRMRRVILQDAVILMDTKNSDGTETLSNRLIESLPQIFQSQAFLDFKSQLLRAISERRRRIDIVNPTVQIDNNSMVGAFNTLGRQSQGTELELRKVQQAMDQLSQRVDEGMGRTHELIRNLSSSRSSLPATPAIPTSQDQYQQMLQIKALQLMIDRLQSFSPLPQSPNLLHQHSPQSNAQGSQQTHSLPHTDLNPSQQLPDLDGVHPYEADDRVKGYIMKPDNGQITVKQAWDEFHGPIAEAKNRDKKWPYTSSRKRAYHRRKQFIELIKGMAEDGQPSEAFLDEVSEKYRGRTINNVLEELKQLSKD